MVSVIRNQYYGGEFSSHSLTSLIEWENGFKKEITGIESSSKPSDEVNPVYETLECNNDLNKYYFDVDSSFDEKCISNWRLLLLKFINSLNM